MANPDKRWTVYDREENAVYLPEERWSHIVDLANHPEMIDYEEHIQTTIRKGRRRQEPLNPRKYRYVHPFDDLPNGMTHIVAIVLFGFDIDEQGATVANNFIATTFLKHIMQKGDRA